VSIANKPSKTRGSPIIGAPRETVGTVRATGQFYQLSISASGPKASGSVTLHLVGAGVKVPRSQADFGQGLGWPSPG